MYRQCFLIQIESRELDYGPPGVPLPPPTTECWPMQGWPLGCGESDPGCHPVDFVLYPSHLGGLLTSYPEFRKKSIFSLKWPLGVPKCCFYYYFSEKNILVWLWRHYRGKIENSNFPRFLIFRYFALLGIIIAVTQPFLDGFSKTKYLQILWNKS